jgi:bacteriorhodopsin
MIGFFVLSTVAYVMLMYPLLTAVSPHRAAVAKYILVGWTGFPIAFLLAPDGFGLISAVAAAIIYLLLDVFTKVIFYLDLHKKMVTEAER